MLTSLVLPALRPPYLVTRVTPHLFHLAVLPDLDAGTLREAVRRQGAANRLDSCAVLGRAGTFAVDADGGAHAGAAIPYATVGHHVASAVEGRLALVPLPEDDGGEDRRRALADAVAAYHERRNAECRRLGIAPVSPYLLGDPDKGGRPATADELRGLRGRRRRAAGWRWWPRGVPLGLAHCGTCDGWTGECLDPDPTFAGSLMRVYCRCENVNRCAACGALLCEWRLNANYYDLADDVVMHVPGFCGLGHRCQAEGRS